MHFIIEENFYLYVKHLKEKPIKVLGNSFVELCSVEF